MTISICKCNDVHVDGLVDLQITWVGLNTYNTHERVRFLEFGMTKEFEDTMMVAFR